MAPESQAANSWEDVADLSAALGVVLDPWQEDVLKAALGERRDGLWAARQVGLSAPRQNGKSQLIVARILAGALLFGEKKIVVSAHQQDTSRETFAKFLEIYDESEALRKRVKSVMNALNRESITFTNGAKVQFKARTGSGGRGFSSDCLLLDEAQILSSRTWASINSTMSARPNPQVWMMGTPPTPEDDGEVFGRVRQAALSGGSSGLAYLEWSADPDDDPAKERTRWKANPAWASRINHGVVEGEFQSYSKEEFARERLGIWDSERATRGAIDQAAWAGTKIPAASVPDEGVKSYAVKFSADGARVALSVALRPAEGPVHVEGIRVANMGEGTGWLVDFLAERASEAAQIVVDGKFGTGFLVNALRDAGVRNKRQVVTPTFDQVKSAHSMFLQAIQSGGVTTIAQDELDAEARDAQFRELGKDGGFGWAFPEGGSVLLLETVTFAFWAAKTSRRKPGNRNVVEVF